MARNGDLSATQSPQEGTLSYTVLTNKTIAMTISQSERGIGQDTVAANPNIDIIDPDILALGLRVGAQLKRVNSHEEFFVGHAVIRLGDETGRFVLHRLHLFLFLFGTDLALRLLELLPVHLGLDLSSIGRLQVNRVSCETQGRGHVPLGSNVDSLVQLLGGEGHLSPFRINAIRRAQAGDELLHEIFDSLFILRREIPRGRDEKLGDRFGGLRQR